MRKHFISLRMNITISQRKLDCQVRPTNPEVAGLKFEVYRFSMTGQIKRENVCPCKHKKQSYKLLNTISVLAKPGYLIKNIIASITTALSYLTGDQFHKNYSLESKEC